MRKFYLHINLETCQILSASGFNSDSYQEAGSSLAVGTKYEFDNYVFFLWGRFYSFTHQTSFQDWIKRFNPSAIADWLSSADGDFIIIVVDLQNRQVHLISDRNGQYRAYTHHNQSALLISNSLQEMIRLMGGARLSSYGIYQLLTIKHVMDPYSLLEEVWVQPIGQIQTFGRGSHRRTSYYRPVELEPPYLKTPAECVAALDEALQKVCVKRLTGEGYPNLLLSGGIDSVALLMYLSKVAPGQVYTTTYSVEGFKENELGTARIAADHFKSQHREVIVPTSKLTDYYIEGILDSDTPYYGSVVLKVVKQTLEEQNIPFEVFGGIDTRLHTPSVDRVREIGLWVNAHFAHPRLASDLSFGRYWPDYFAKRLLPKASYAEYIIRQFLGYTPPPANHISSNGHFDTLLRALPELIPGEDRAQTFKKCIDFNYRCQYTDDMNYHVSVLESERLNVHIPFCDYEFVQVCNKVPYRIGAKPTFTLNSGRRFVPFVDKWVMRQLLQSSVPAKLLYQHKGAPDELYMLFNEPSFRQLLDTILGRWSEALIKEVDETVRVMLVNLIHAYSEHLRFSSTDGSLLRCIYHIAYLAMINQMCLDPSFDLATALEEARYNPESSPV